MLSLALSMKYHMPGILRTFSRRTTAIKSLLQTQHCLNGFSGIGSTTTTHAKITKRYICLCRYLNLVIKSFRPTKIHFAYLVKLSRGKIKLTELSSNLLGVSSTIASLKLTSSKKAKKAAARQKYQHTASKSGLPIKHCFYTLQN